MDEKTPTQASYDLVAEQYAAKFFDELSHKPFDRQLLDRFAEAVQRENQNNQGEAAGAVWDIGCGPGHIARYLHERGLAVGGLDLSERMVACAQRLNPDIPFVQGNMLALPVADETLAGIVAFYSIIHLARAEVVEALREFRRALRPGGHLLLAFHGGEGEIHNEEWFGEKVDVIATLFSGAEVEEYAQAAGFTFAERLERAPYDFEYPSRRIYLWVRKSA